MLKDLISKKTIIIAAIAVLIVIITIVSVNVFDSGGPVTGLANTLVRPVKKLATDVVRSFESIYNAIYKYEVLKEQYDEAVSRLVFVQQNFRESEVLMKENDDLREALDFKKRHTSYVLEEAAVRSWSGNNWVSSFTISKGYLNADKELARGNCVITANGVLIGLISDVGPDTSTVVTVLDTTFAAAAFVGDSGDQATIKGDFALMRSGLLKLDHINENTIVLPGDSIVTSGGGGVLPVGLVIGEVIEVNRYETGIGRYATVVPTRKIDSTITAVYIITSFEVTG